MKSIITGVALAAMSCAILSAQAPPNPTITLNETGQGTIQLPNGAVIPLVGARMSDPGPGGLGSALAFTFRPAEGSAFLVGDVLMLGVGGVISDVIRFNPAAVIAGVLTQQVFFYSTLGGGLLADTGLPSAFYTNAVSIVENAAGTTVYMPTAGQPGFNPGSALPTTWRFTSPVLDGGSSVAVFAIALGGLALLRLGQSRRLLLSLGALLTLSHLARAADPSASVTLANVTTRGDTIYSFTVRYFDDECLADNLIDDNDIRITGPNGFDVPARFVSRVDGAPPFGAVIFATYSFVPPGGLWDSADNGSYDVIMQPNQVTDCISQAVHGGKLGSFSVAVSGPPEPVAAQPLNVSTRGRVQTGQNVMIGGFIIAGNAPKKVIVRAVGPSLAKFGLSDVLADPVISLHGPGGLITSNDNWKETQQTAIEASTLAPSDEREAAIVATLPPGAYTAIMEGKNQTGGVGLVEVYDLDWAANSKLANISTRGFVETGSNITIGGFILGNADGPAKILVRAVGPTLAQFGLKSVLADPTLDLRDANGALVRSNNNWKDSQPAEIQMTGLAPGNDLEAAMVATLPPGAYTALVSGANGTTGLGLVEVYRVE